MSQNSKYFEWKLVYENQDVLLRPQVIYMIKFGQPEEFEWTSSAACLFVILA